MMPPGPATTTAAAAAAIAAVVRAVVRAVREALLYAQANQSALFNAPNTCATTDSVETIDTINVNEAQPQSVEEL